MLRPPPILNERGVHSRVWGSKSGTCRRASPGFTSPGKSSGAKAALSHLHDEGTSTTFPLGTGSACSSRALGSPSRQLAGIQASESDGLLHGRPGCFHPAALRGVGRALAELLYQDPCGFTFYLWILKWENFGTTKHLEFIGRICVLFLWL